MNLSRSAYACFKFHDSFFINYDDGSKELPDDSDAEEMLKCKIAMKVNEYILNLLEYFTFTTDIIN